MIDIRKELFFLKDDNYKEFQGKLLPNVDNFIGVRVPIVRNLLRKMSESDKIEYIDNYTCEYLEEYLLKGLIISGLKNTNEIIKYLDDFVPFIDNWEVCDTVILSLKSINKNKKLFYSYIKKYLHSNNEFEKRFALVVLLTYYVEDKYIDDIIDVILNVRCDYYYDKMAKAWLIQVCYVKFRYKILDILDKIDNDIYIIAKRKILDSKKVSIRDKEILRKSPYNDKKTAYNNMYV